MSDTTRFCFLALAALLLLTGCDNDGNRIVGQLESDRLELVAEFAEPIIETRVAEGEAVTAGQLLSQQNTARISARIDAADAAVAERRDRLAELIRGPREERIVAARASVEGANRTLELRELEYAREKKLLEQKLASPQSRDQAKAALEVARANVEFSEAQLEELLAGTTSEELAQAEQALLGAQAQLQALQVDRDRHSVLAPVDGIVDSILFLPGEHPPVGMPFLILLAGKQPYARIYVPAALRVAVTPGLAARVYVEGLSEPLDGRVRWVSSEAAFTPYFALTEHDRGRLTYVAKVDIADRQQRLPDGIPVEVEFPGLALRPAP